MKVSTTLPLLFATLALANPAPASNPRVPAIAQPEAREAAPVPEIVARTAGIVLDDRSPKKGSSSGSGSKNTTNNTDSAAGTITISRGLQLGALGLGVMEVVRLWG